MDMRIIPIPQGLKSQADFDKWMDQQINNLINEIVTEPQHTASEVVNSKPCVQEPPGFASRAEERRAKRHANLDVTDRVRQGDNGYAAESVGPKVYLRTKAREDAYTAIDTERQYQNDLWQQPNNPGYPNQMSIGDFILLLEEYSAKARAMWSTEKRPEKGALDIIRKVAGIAVNAMEQHGAPRRAGY